MNVDTTCCSWGSGLIDGEQRYNSSRLNQRVCQHRAVFLIANPSLRLGHTRCLNLLLLSSVLSVHIARPNVRVCIVT